VGRGGEAQAAADVFGQAAVPAQCLGIAARLRQLGVQVTLGTALYESSFTTHSHLLAGTESTGTSCILHIRDCKTIFDVWQIRFTRASPNA
jgi:hypothetical protein